MLYTKALCIVCRAVYIFSLESLGRVEAPRRPVVLSFTDAGSNPNGPNPPPPPPPPPDES